MHIVPRSFLTSKPKHPRQSIHRSALHCSCCTVNLATAHSCGAGFPAARLPSLNGWARSAAFFGHSMAAMSRSLAPLEPLHSGHLRPHAYISSVLLRGANRAVGSSASTELSQPGQLTRCRSAHSRVCIRGSGFWRMFSCHNPRRTSVHLWTLRPAKTLQDLPAWVGAEAGSTLLIVVKFPVQLIMSLNDQSA